MCYRTLGWGGGYNGENIAQIIRSVLNATPVCVDRYVKKRIFSIVSDCVRWSLNITDPQTQVIRSSPLMNYFSIGAYF